MPNVELRAEYLYVSFEKLGAQATQARAAALGPPGFTRNTSYSQQLNIVRIGADFHFWAPRRAFVLSIQKNEGARRRFCTGDWIDGLPMPVLQLSSAGEQELGCAEFVRNPLLKAPVPAAWPGLLPCASLQAASAASIAKETAQVTSLILRSTRSR